jgi:hypothetical protein
MHGVWGDNPKEEKKWIVKEKTFSLTRFFCGCKSETNSCSWGLLQSHKNRPATKTTAGICIMPAVDASSILGQLTERRTAYD